MALLRSSAIVGPCDGSDLTCFKMDLPNDEVKILVFSVLRIAPLGVACFVNSSKRNSASAKGVTAFVSST